MLVQTKAKKAGEIVEAVQFTGDVSVHPQIFITHDPHLHYQIGGEKHGGPYDSSSKCLELNTWIIGTGDVELVSAETFEKDWQVVEDPTIVEVYCVYKQRKHIDCGCAIRVDDLAYTCRAVVDFNAQQLSKADTEHYYYVKAESAIKISAHACSISGVTFKLDTTTDEELHALKGGCADSVLQKLKPNTVLVDFASDREFILCPLVKNFSTGKEKISLMDVQSGEHYYINSKRFFEATKFASIYEPTTPEEIKQPPAGWQTEYMNFVVQRFLPLTQNVRGLSLRIEQNCPVGVKIPSAFALSIARILIGSIDATSTDAYLEQVDAKAKVVLACYEEFSKIAPGFDSLPRCNKSAAVDFVAAFIGMSPTVFETISAENYCINDLIFKVTRWFNLKFSNEQTKIDTTNPQTPV